MADWLEAIFQRAPDACAGWRDGAPVTHGALIERARAWAALGLRTAGCDIALYMDDSLEFAAALLGAWQAHKTVWLAADTLPATCAALADKVGAFWGAYPPACSPATPAPGERSALPWQMLAPVFPALVVHTSGSAGAPKAVPKSMAQIGSELAALETAFGARIKHAEVVATVTHQHIYGLLFRVLWPLAASRAIHAVAYAQPEALAQALAARPCVLVASPAHLKRLPAHLDWAGAATQLRAVFSSGGVLEDAAAAHAHGLLNAALLEVYGSSETGGVAWRERSTHVNAPAPAWLPLPGVAWRLQEGLLEVRSPHALPDEWLATADRAAAVGAGFALLGRSDRIAKIEEKRVALDVLEAALLASGLAAEARVVACRAPGSERQWLAAFMMLTPSGSAVLAQEGKAALDRRLRARLATCAEAVVLPRRWRYLTQLPLGAQGKVSDAQLRALLDAPRPTLPEVRLIEADVDQLLLALRVPADLLYFDGHFAIAPVLPGVVQVDWAILFARRHFDIAGDFCGMQALKFQQMIKPNQAVRLALRFDAAAGCLHFRYLSDAGPHASGRILFASPC